MRIQDNLTNLFIIVSNFDTFLCSDLFININVKNIMISIGYKLAKKCLAYKLLYIAVRASN